MKSVRYIIIFVIVVLTIVLVRLFLVGSYRITGDKMGYTLNSGDRILVNKLKSNTNPGPNRLVLYKSPLRRDASKPPLFTGRCIGLPGDAIQMGVEGFRVNGLLLPDAPMMQPTFRINKDIKEPLLSTLDSLRIPLRDIKEDSASILLRMSLREKELLIQNLSKVVPINIIGEYNVGYEFIIPRKGVSININEISLLVCKEAIINEAGDAARISDGKLFINGEEKSSFSFRNDYYWILSENESEGVDSRHLGLIPKDYIIGNIWYCWYSKNPSYRFKKIR